MKFKNIVTGRYIISEKISAVSVVKYTEKGNEQSMLVVETVNQEKILLHKIALQPKVRSNEAILVYQPISLESLQQLPTNTRCQTWNISREVMLVLETLILDQQRLNIHYQNETGNVLYTSRSWENPTIPRTSLACAIKWLGQCRITVDHRWDSFQCNLTSGASIVNPIQGTDVVSVSSHSSGFFSYSQNAQDRKLAFHDLGQKHLIQKNYPLALKQFDAALKLDSRYEEAKQGKVYAHFGLGMASYNECDYVTAEQHFKDILAIFPDHAAAKEGLLLIQAKLSPAVKTPVEQSKKFRHRIENLVFQGGGIKGLAYAGNFEELLSGDYEFSLDMIKRVGGTSAGAMTALILGLGYNLDEIKEILTTTDFTAFFDGPYQAAFLDLNTRSEAIAAKVKQATQGGAVSAVSGLATLYTSDPDFAKIKEGISLLQDEGFGLFSADAIRDWAEEKIRLKTGGIKNATGKIEGGIECATFRELYELKQRDPDKYKEFKDMYFVAVNRTLNRVEVFSYEHTPDVIVSDALRASISIPLIFKAHRIFIKTAATGFRPKPDPKGYFYVDGGVLSNLPIWLFDDKRYLSGSQEAGYELNPHTLAFMLVNPNKKSDQEANTRSEQAMPEGLFSYIKELIECIFSNREREIPTIDNRHRVIFIDNKGVKTTEFNITPFKRDLLLLSGRCSVRDYFARLLQEKAIEKIHIHPNYFTYLDPTKCDASGNTLLHTAVIKGDGSLIQYLCEHKIELIDKSAKNIDNQTVLDLARNLHHPQQEEILRLLQLLNFPETNLVHVPKI